MGTRGTPNLRDQSYKQVFDAVMACRSRVPGVTNLDLDQNWLARGADKSKFKDVADGVAFFAPVEQDASGAKFKHLVGNVAEIVCDSRKGGDGLSRTLSSATEFVKAPGQSQAFATIGDSAFGDVRPDPTEPRRLVVTTNNKAQMNKGWSDVGVRLAFSPISASTGPAVAEADLLTKVRQAFEAGRPYVAVAKSS